MLSLSRTRPHTLFQHFFHFQANLLQSHWHITHPSLSYLHYNPYSPCHPLIHQRTLHLIHNLSHKQGLLLLGWWYEVLASTPWFGMFGVIDHFANFSRQMEKLPPVTNEKYLRIIRLFVPGSPSKNMPLRVNLNGKLLTLLGLNFR